MKFEKLFESFLVDEVNLNANRVATAKEGIRVVTEFLQNNDFFCDKIISISPQGSFRQKTIIKPSNGKDFDVDILMEMSVIDNYEPKDYLGALHKEFKNTKRYEDIVDTKGKSRCVTLDYDSDFHIDIVPCVFMDDGYKIMDKKDNVFEDTDADGYAEWFAQKNVIAKNRLVEVVRLVKYLRDIKNTFSVKSVLLTTLLGMQVYDGDAEELYADLPTALVTLINRLNEFLQENELVPIITNPVLDGENFNRHWDQDKYENFRNMTLTYASKINEAYEESDVDKSLKKWQDVFGDDFCFSEQEKGMSNSVVLMDTSHCMLPIWPSISSQCTVGIKCYAKNDKGINVGLIASDSRMIGDKWELKYQAEVQYMPPAAEIYWQVVNTGKQAKDEGGLRGVFFRGKDLEQIRTVDPKINWETTRYNGKHWIECFVVDSGILIARSGRFYINVVPKPSLPYYRRKY